MLDKLNLEFHFYIPEYSSYSNGIKTLWEAAFEFQKFHKTTVSTFNYGEGGEALPEKYLHLLGEVADKKKCIAIYPDCIEGNPLKINNVARFLMAKPNILNGLPIKQSDSDFVFAYSNAVNNGLPQYNLILKDLQELSRIKPSKDLQQVSIYYGKCRVGNVINQSLREIANQFSNFKIITRSHPGTKEILYQTISNSALFISFDPLTSLCYESTILGTPALILDPVFKESYQNYNYPLHDFYYTFKDAVNGINSTNKKIINLELDKQVNLSYDKTERIVSKIIEHFSGNKSSNYSSDLELSDRNFYRVNWGKSPIYNCTTLKSIIRLHLINRSAPLFIAIKFFLKLKNLLIEAPNLLIFYFQSIPRMVAIFILGREDYMYVEYLKSQKKYSEEFENEEKLSMSYQTNLNDVISVSKSKLKIIWSI